MGGFAVTGDREVAQRSSRCPPSTPMGGFATPGDREVAQRFGRVRVAGWRGALRLTPPRSTRRGRAQARAAPGRPTRPRAARGGPRASAGRRTRRPGEPGARRARGSDLATPAAAAGGGPPPWPSVPRAAGPTTPRTALRRAARPGVASAARAESRHQRGDVGDRSRLARGLEDLGRPVERSGVVPRQRAPATRRAAQALDRLGHVHHPRRGRLAQPHQLGDAEEERDRVVGRRRPLQQQRRPGRHEVVGQLVDALDAHADLGLGDPAPRHLVGGRQRPGQGAGAPPVVGDAPGARHCGDRLGSTTAAGGSSMPSIATSAGGRTVCSAPWLKATANGSGEAFSISMTVRPPSSAVQ